MCKIYPPCLIDGMVTGAGAPGRSATCSRVVMMVARRCGVV